MILNDEAGNDRKISEALAGQSRDYPGTGKFDLKLRVDGGNAFDIIGTPEELDSLITLLTSVRANLPSATPVSKTDFLLKSSI